LAKQAQPSHTRICPPPFACNFHRHVTKRPLRWLGAWRRALKTVPLHAPSHLNALLSMFDFISADITPYFSFPTSPSYHVPSPPFAHVDNEMARCVCEDTCGVLVYVTNYFRTCLFILILFLGDLASHTHPSRCDRPSHYMRTSCGMPRFIFRPCYRTFRTPSCVLTLEKYSELRFKPAWPSVGVLYMYIMPASRPRFCPHCTRVWHLACCAVP
jgi:hypothetical protein